jgi:anaerobic magnesium-protoporphyrin IX monomethyl ester cyclase
VKSVVLLNPPSRKLQIRDLYCSKTSEGNYYWPPIDLLVISGLLKAEYGLTVVDAVAEGLSRAEALRRVADARPFAVVSMTGSCSWAEDSAFLREVKAACGCLVAVTGDVAVDPVRWPLDDAEAVDALVLDFTSRGIVEYLAADGRPSAPPPDIVCRIGGAPAGGRGAAEGSFSYPVPRHDLFPLNAYRLPYVSRYPLTSVLTNYACPFTCSYCIQNRTVLGYKHRRLDNTLEELDALHRLKVPEVYFRDPLFESHRENAKSLCLAMKDRFRFTWSCNCRVNTVTEELISLMRDAGCRCISFGFETANEETLRRYEKPVTMEQAERAVRLCKKYGIRIGGYFMLGLPGEDRAAALRTIRFSVDSGIDYASFTVPAPDYGTRLRTEAVARGKIGPDHRVFNRSRVKDVLSDELNEEELKSLLRRAVRSFYLRPSYVLKTLVGLRSWRQAKETVRAALHVVRGHG